MAGLCHVPAQAHKGSLLLSGRVPILENDSRSLRISHLSSLRVLAAARQSPLDGQFAAPIPQNPCIQAHRRVAKPSQASCYKATRNR